MRIIHKHLSVKPTLMSRFSTNDNQKDLQSSHLVHSNVDADTTALHDTSSFIAPIIAAGSFIMMSSSVNAAIGAPVSNQAIASAFVAYGHYLCLIVMVSCVLIERILIKSDMTIQDEDRFVIADSVYGIAGVLMLVTGRLHTYDRLLENIRLL